MPYVTKKDLHTLNEAFWKVYIETGYGDVRFALSEVKRYVSELRSGLWQATGQQDHITHAQLERVLGDLEHRIDVTLEHYREGEAEAGRVEHVWRLRFIETMRKHKVEPST